MARINFADVLNVQLDDIKKPALLPPGTYMCGVQRWLMPAGDSDKQWQSIGCLLNVIAPTDDTDPTAITEFGNVVGERVVYSFLFDAEDERQRERTAFKVREFCELHLGVTVPTGGTLKDLMDASIGYNCYAVVEWEPRRNDPSIVDLRVRRTSAVG